MKISYNWLKQFIKTTWEAEKTGDLLTDLGLEIEGIEDFSSIPGGLEGVVIGHVLTCEKHPNADRLKITTVDIGTGEPIQIVCGAPNVDVGQKVPVATVGTTLYDGDRKPWKIKKGKIRGEVSMGMICAEDELGLGKGHDGIMILDTEATPGTKASELFEIENDKIFEIGLTPNRADAMSHWGVARDLRAGMTQQNESLELITPSNSHFNIENRTLKIEVNVDDNNLAPRYAGVTISGITVQESPTWLKNRLKSIGLSPINNVVDITNYVLHELGQPLHAFDAAKITGNEINVQTLPEGTKFKTLDGVERTLSAEDLMICNADKPMCIAGVFGGIDSGVTSKTSNIFLESAYFNPVSIRKTAKRHGLNTDASFRFERGIDPNSVEYALKRASILICEVTGGIITSEVTDVYPKKIEDHQVFLNYDKAASLIGETIEKETIKKILTSLEIKVNNVTETGIGMTIPAYRNDVTREVDVIEEILRVYGYNTVKASDKFNASIATTLGINDHEISHKVASQLAAQGFNEMLNNSLTSPNFTELTDDLSTKHTIKILNPLSHELSAMRQSMLFGGLQSLAYNSNRRQSNISLFEFGKTYHNFPNGKEEKKHLSILVSGNQTEDNWIQNPSMKGDFHFLKGVVVSILNRLGIKDISEKSLKNDLFAEGISLSHNKKALVSLGIITRKATKNFGIEAEILFADFDWDSVLEMITTANVMVKPIPKFPRVKRDFALLLDDPITFNELKISAMQTERELLKEVTLFDVYTGKNLPDGKKSYALSFTLQDENKTLTDKQIDKVMTKLQQRFEKDFGAALR